MNYQSQPPQGSWRESRNSWNTGDHCFPLVPSVVLLTSWPFSNGLSCRNAFAHNASQLESSNLQVQSCGSRLLLTAFREKTCHER